MFFCSNCLDREEVESYCTHLGIDKRMAISLPCSGKVDLLYLIKAFETGADGVVVLTCQIGECQHLEGNKRAKKRAQAVDSLMDEIGAGRGRIAVFEVKPQEHAQTIALITQFFKSVEPMPAGARMEAVT